MDTESTIKPLEEMSVTELKEELTNMGQGEVAETLKEKKQLLSVIASLKVQPGNPENVVIPPAEAPVKSLEEVANPSRDRKDELSAQTKTDRMAAKLAAQPKTQVMLHLEPKERAGKVEERIINGRRQVVTEGAVETVQLNGYITYIPKGVPTMVPEQVAKELGQSMTETAMAGKDLEIDREDNRPGAAFKNVSEALK